MHYKTHISLIREYILLLNSDMCQGGKPDTGKFQSSYIGMNAYENGCMVDGTCATAMV